jgi:ATP-binding cassette subfamily F protein 3
VAERMKDGTESKIRGKCAQLGFPATKADTPVSLLSGGEKARLMMGLAAFDGPHLLILDEPTNHLDIDSRAALIEAINEYEGAIVIIAHDRYLIDACADRLWLVDGGTVKTFDGDMADYKSLVLSRAGGGSGGSTRKAAKAEKAAPETRPPSPAKAAHQTKKQIAALDEKIKKLGDLVTRIDAALVDPNAYSRDKNKASQLAQQRKDLARALEVAEDEWLALTTLLEAAE